MGDRKSAKDWRKTYGNAKATITRIETEVTERLLELCKANPNVIIGLHTDIDRTPIKASSLEKRYVEEALTPEGKFKFIEIIEKALADAHPHQQGDLFEVSEPDFIEYHDKGDGYQPPERKIENEVLEIRLYCSHENCMTYIKGQEGYNGAFHAETGQYCDLRNQGFNCKKHC